MPDAFPEPNCAARYRETNPLVPLQAYDPLSFTRSCKALSCASDATCSPAAGCSNEKDDAAPSVHNWGPDLLDSGRDN